MDYIFTCSHCNQKTLTPSFEDTYQEYIKLYEKEALLVPQAIPNKYPNFIICRCLNKSCSVIVRYSHEEFAKLLTQEWANSAWYQVLLEKSDNFNVENFYSRYLIDKNLNGITISKKDLEKNPVLRDLFYHVERESIKDSND